METVRPPAPRRFPRARAPRVLAATLQPRLVYRALPWLLAALCCACASGLLAQVAINTTSAPPLGNAILDISSTNKGLLAPRITSSQRNTLSFLAPMPYSATLDGLIVYQTDSTGTSPSGYYYYDNSTAIPGWRHLAWGPELWRLGGNAGTTSADFLGTTNNMPLMFRTHNQDRGRLSETGQFQLYYTPVPPTPSEIMEVQGGVKLNGGSLGNNEGTIKFTPASGGSPAKFEGNIANTGLPAGILPSVNGWKQLDNNFTERKIQESPIPGVGCQDPSSLTNPSGGARPWPSPGPTTFTSVGGPFSPYYTFWEDGHRQYLYQGPDLALTGMCPGPSNPIRAIAFNVSASNGSPGRIHFLYFRLKNTPLATIAGFDMSGLSDFAMPKPPEIPGPPPSYASGHLTGYQVTSGWNVHPYSDGITPALPGTGFVWTGGNLLIDASLDDQEWTGPSILDGSVQAYNSIAGSNISMFCDACGGTGANTCLWTNPVAPPFYYPPTTPTNGLPGSNSNAGGWGWIGGWNLVASTNTITCDGTYAYNPGGGAAIGSQLPRVAFLCSYIGGGAALDVASYLAAQEGVMVGDAVWAASGSYPNNAYKGPGTINAQRSVWSNASLLSDYVFDLYYDGTAKPEDAKGANTYTRLPLKELPNYVERERHLPTIDGRKKWNADGTFSVDGLTNQLWVTVEDQALYIQELNKRMDALQQYLVDKKLKELAEGDKK